MYFLKILDTVNLLLLLAFRNPVTFYYPRNFIEDFYAQNHFFDLSDGFPVMGNL